MEEATLKVLKAANSGTHQSTAFWDQAVALYLLYSAGLPSQRFSALRRSATRGLGRACPNNHARRATEGWAKNRLRAAGRGEEIFSCLESRVTIVQKKVATELVGRFSRWTHDAQAPCGVGLVVGVLRDMLVARFPLGVPPAAAPAAAPAPAVAEAPAVVAQATAAPLGSGVRGGGTGGGGTRAALAAGVRSGGGGDAASAPSAAGNGGGGAAAAAAAGTRWFTPAAPKKKDESKTVSSLLGENKAFKTKCPSKAGADCATTANATTTTTSTAPGRSSSPVSFEAPTLSSSPPPVSTGGFSNSSDGPEDMAPTATRAASKSTITVSNTNKGMESSAFRAPGELGAAAIDGVSNYFRPLSSMWEVLGRRKFANVQQQQPQPHLLSSLSSEEKNHRSSPAVLTRSTPVTAEIAGHSEATAGKIPTEPSRGAFVSRGGAGASPPRPPQSPPPEDMALHVVCSHFSVGGSAQPDHGSLDRKRSPGAVPRAYGGALEASEETMMVPVQRLHLPPAPVTVHTNVPSPAPAPSTESSVQVFDRVLKASSCSVSPSAAASSPSPTDGPSPTLEASTGKSSVAAAPSPPIAATVQPVAASPLAATVQPVAAAARPSPPSSSSSVPSLASSSASASSDDGGSAATIASDVETQLRNELGEAQAELVRQRKLIDEMVARQLAFERQVARENREHDKEMKKMRSELDDLLLLKIRYLGQDGKGDLRSNNTIPPPRQPQPLWEDDKAIPCSDILSPGTTYPSTPSPGIGSPTIPCPSISIASSRILSLTFSWSDILSPGITSPRMPSLSILSPGILCSGNLSLGIASPRFPSQDIPSPGGSHENGLATAKEEEESEERWLMQSEWDSRMRRGRSSWTTFMNGNCRLPQRVISRKPSAVLPPAVLPPAVPTVRIVPSKDGAGLGEDDDNDDDDADDDDDDDGDNESDGGDEDEDGEDDDDEDDDGGDGGDDDDDGGDGGSEEVGENIDHDEGDEDDRGGDDGDGDGHDDAVGFTKSTGSGGDDVDDGGWLTTRGSATEEQKPQNNSRSCEREEEEVKVEEEALHTKVPDCTSFVKPKEPTTQGSTTTPDAGGKLQQAKLAHTRSTERLDIIAPVTVPVPVTVTVPVTEAQTEKEAQKETENKRNEGLDCYTKRQSRSPLSPTSHNRHSLENTTETKDKIEAQDKGEATAVSTEAVHPCPSFSIFSFRPICHSSASSFSGSSASRRVEPSSSEDPQVSRTTTTMMMTTAGAVPATLAPIVEESKLEEEQYINQEEGEDSKEEEEEHLLARVLGSWINGGARRLVERRGGRVDVLLPEYRVSTEEEEKVGGTERAVVTEMPDDEGNVEDVLGTDEIEADEKANMELQKLWRTFRSGEGVARLNSSVTCLRKLFKHHPQMFREQPRRVEEVFPVLLTSLTRGLPALAVNGLRCLVDMLGCADMSKIESYRVEQLVIATVEHFTSATKHLVKEAEEAMEALVAHGPHAGLLDAVLPFIYDRHPTVVTKAVSYTEKLLDVMGVGALDGGAVEGVDVEAVLSALAKALEGGEAGGDMESAKRSLARCCAAMGTEAFEGAMGRYLGGEIGLGGETLTVESFSTMGFLGSGTYGRVTKAKKRVGAMKGVCFAVKAISKKVVTDYGRLQHVKNEKMLLEKLGDSTFVVKLFSTFQDDNQVFLATELLEGGTLMSRIEQAGPTGMCLDHTRFYAAGIVEALSYMHRHGVAFRDLKPDNVMIAADGYPTIIDLGFAKKVTPLTRATKEAGTDTENRCHSMIGTSHYMAPEVLCQGVTNKGHNKSVDAWALGVVVYEMVTTLTPFEPDIHIHMTSDQRLEHVSRAQKEPLVFPDWLFGGVAGGSECQDLISGLLTVDESNRLGCGVNGMDDVKRHPMFRDIDWDALATKTLAAPWVPPRVSRSEMADEEGPGIASSSDVFEGNQDDFADF